MTYEQVQCPHCDKWIANKAQKPQKKPQKLINPLFLVTVLVWAITLVRPIDLQGFASVHTIASMGLTIQLLRGLKMPNWRHCHHCGFRWEELPEWKV